MLSIYIDSLEKHERTQANKLLSFYSFADKNKYRITVDPKSADIILICDVRFDNYGEYVRINPLIRKNINKCFILSNNDRPLSIFRGILTSAEKSIINFDRIRSCSYNAYSDSFKNSFITNHIPLKKETPKKKYLFSFIGRDCNLIRRQIFEMAFHRKDILIEDSGNTFNVYDKDVNAGNRQKYYYDIMLQSKFALCPAGWSANSYRLFEAMSLGIVPVIISDDWILPKGPQWKDFSLIIRKKDIQNLEDIILEKESEFAAMGSKARKAFEKYFEDTVFFEYIISNCIAIKKNQIIPESVFFYILNPLYIQCLKFRNGKLISIQKGLNLIVTKPLDIFKKSNLEKIKRFFML